MNKKEFIKFINNAEESLNWGVCYALDVAVGRTFVWNYRLERTEGIIDHFKKTMEKLRLITHPKSIWWLRYSYSHAQFSDINQGYRFLCLGIYKEYMLETREYKKL